MKNDCPLLFLSYKSLKSIKNESKGAQDSFILLYAYFDSVTTSGLSPKTKRCMNTCPLFYTISPTTVLSPEKKAGYEYMNSLLPYILDSVLSPKTKRCMDTCPFPNIPSPGLSGSLSKSVFHLIGKIQNRISELVHCVLEMGYALKGNISQY